MQSDLHTKRTIFPGTNHRLLLEPHEVMIPEGWHEACVTKTVHGKELIATVPLIALGPNKDTLPVKVLGYEADEVWVVLPVGNDGTQMWGIPEDDFLGMLISDDQHTLHRK
jgi:hypothetical protein